MSRPWVIWLVLSGCAVVILGMLSKMTVHGLRSERKRIEMEAQSQVSEDEVVTLPNGYRRRRVARRGKPATAISLRVVLFARGYHDQHSAGRGQRRCSSAFTFAPGRAKPRKDAL